MTLTHAARLGEGVAGRNGARLAAPTTLPGAERRSVRAPLQMSLGRLRLVIDVGRLQHERLAPAECDLLLHALHVDLRDEVLHL